MSDTDKTVLIFAIVFIIFVLILAEGGSGYSMSTNEAEYFDSYVHGAAGR